MSKKKGGFSLFRSSKKAPPVNASPAVPTEPPPRAATMAGDSPRRPRSPPREARNARPVSPPVARPTDAANAFLTLDKTQTRNAELEHSLQQAQLSNSRIVKEHAEVVASLTSAQSDAKEKLEAALMTREQLEEELRALLALKPEPAEKMASELKSHVAAAHHLRNELMQAKEEVTEREGRIVLLEAALQDLRNGGGEQFAVSSSGELKTAQRLQSDLDAAKEEVTEREGRIVMLEAALQSSAPAREELAAARRRLQAMESATAESVNSHNEIRDLKLTKAQLEKRISEYGKIQDEVQALMAASSLSAAESESLRETVFALEQRIAGPIAGSMRRKEEAALMAQEQVKELEATKAKLEQRIAGPLAEAMARREQELLELRKHLEGSEETNVRFMQGLSDEKIKLEEETDQIRGAMMARQAQVDELKRCAEKDAARMRDLEAQISQLKDDATAAQKESAELREQALALEQCFKDSVSHAIQQRDNAVRMVQLQLVQLEANAVELEEAVHVADTKAAGMEALAHSRKVELDERERRGL